MVTFIFCLSFIRVYTGSQLVSYPGYRPLSGLLPFSKVTYCVFRPCSGTSCSGMPQSVNDGEGLHFSHCSCQGLKIFLARGRSKPNSRLTSTQKQNFITDCYKHRHQRSTSEPRGGPGTNPCVQPSPGDTAFSSLNTYQVQEQSNGFGQRLLLASAPS